MLKLLLTGFQILFFSVCLEAIRLHRKRDFNRLLAALSTFSQAMEYFYFRASHCSIITCVSLSILRAAWLALVARLCDDLCL